MPGSELFGLGIIGGAVPEVMVVYSLRGKPGNEWRKYYGGWLSYLGPTILMVLLGGAVALAYNAWSDPVGPVLAVQLGASTPLILRHLSQATPSTISTGG